MGPVHGRGPFPTHAQIPPRYLRSYMRNRLSKGAWGRLELIRAKVSRKDFHQLLMVTALVRGEWTKGVGWPKTLVYPEEISQTLHLSQAAAQKHIELLIEAGFLGEPSAWNQCQ